MSPIKSVAIKVGSRLYVPEEDGWVWPHCDVLEIMPERDQAWALEDEAECFGFVTADGDFLTRAEATERIGYTAEACLMQQKGTLAA